MKHIMISKAKYTARNKQENLEELTLLIHKSNKKILFVKTRTTKKFYFYRAYVFINDNFVDITQLLASVLDYPFYYDYGNCRHAVKIHNDVYIWRVLSDLEIALKYLPNTFKAAF